jgi:CII-binding regulator of phage lambda lysogenization HflD
MPHVLLNATLEKVSYTEPPLDQASGSRSEEAQELETLLSSLSKLLVECMSIFRLRIMVRFIPFFFHR